MSKIPEYLISQTVYELAELADAVVYTKNDMFRDEARDLIYKASECLQHAQKLIERSDNLETEA